MRRFAPLAAALMPLALAGCVMHPAPEIATPTPELPQAFFFRPEASTATALAALMPEGDPAYQTLSQAALADAPNLAEAAARIDTARAGAKGAGANRLPNITADGSVSATASTPRSSDRPGSRASSPPSRPPTAPTSMPAGTSTCSGG